MSRLVSRILLAIFMFPLAAFFYIFVVMVGMTAVRFRSVFVGTETIVFGFSGGLTWAVVAVYWCALWNSTVRWNKRRVGDTWLAAGGAAVVGVLTALIGSVATRGGASFGAFIGGAIAIVLWLIATVFIWRETPAERAQRLAASTGSAITCPTCGYNLTGLRESRCPECGSSFTLDQLMATQTTRAEIE